MDIFEKIKEEANKYFLEANGSHDLDHTMRVLNLALKIGQAENADLEIIKMSSILHDIGRKHQDDCKGQICHAEWGSSLAKELLEKLNLDGGKIEKVINCIKTHRFRGKNKPVSKEARVLYDADKLDSIGAVGIGRAFLFAGEVGAKLHNKNVDILKTKSYSKEDTAYREYLIKLKHIKDKMLTNEGKKYANERHDFMVNFFERINKEVDGEL